MRTLNIILVLPLLIGCSPGFVAHIDPRQFTTVDPEFVWYFNMYESMKGGKITSPAIGFRQLDGNVIGQCIRYSNGYREIAIDPDYWFSPNTSKRAKIGLIFHELGHCDLNRNHINTLHYYNGAYVPDSLMYPYNFYSDRYSMLESYYFQELFNSSSIVVTVSSKQGCVVDIDMTGHGVN